MTSPATSAWSVQESDYPRFDTMERRLRFLVGYAILAPSSHNAQPWRFHVEPTHVDMRLDRSRALPIADPEGRELVISCGAALHHLRVAMARFGLDPVVQLLPLTNEPDLLARVRPSEGHQPTQEEERLFAQVTRRRTNRLAFDVTRIPDFVVDELRAAAEREGAHFVVVPPEARERVAELVEEGDREQGADRSFREELAAWVHPNREGSFDGMTGAAFGMGDATSRVGPWVLKHARWGERQGRKDRDLVMEAPLLAALATRKDEPREWLLAGQALSRVLLRAREDDVWAAYLNQPVQLPGLRPLLREALGTSGVPQVLMRMGRGPDVPPTPRRPVDDVLG